MRPALGAGAARPFQNKDLQPRRGRHAGVAEGAKDETLQGDLVRSGRFQDESVDQALAGYATDNAVCGP